MFRARWTLSSLCLAGTADPYTRHRNGPEALRLAHQVCCSAEGDAASLDVLGMAQAETGDFRGAILSAEHARTRAVLSSEYDRVSQIEGRLKLYRQAKPYREGLPQTTIGSGPS